MPEHNRYPDNNPDLPEEQRLATDAKNLIGIAKTQSEKFEVTVDPITLSRRAKDDIVKLQAAISKEQGTVSTGVKGATIDAAEGNEADETSPKNPWLTAFKTRFDALPQLHAGISWTDVETSLAADTESMAKLAALDAKGHKMNVFGEEDGSFVFVSAWNNYAEVTADHRNIVFDKRAQNWLKKNYPNENCNGNAVDIATAMGAGLADPKYHEQLRRATGVNGWAWLKTDDATRDSGRALYGDDFGVSRYGASYRDDRGSFRAALRVRKA